jgi:anti-sigma regulatory factor (Ser/Thr protein kinase)
MMPRVAAGQTVGRDLGPLVFTLDQLAQVRGAVQGMLTGLDRERAADVVLAVHEVAVNSVVHGTGAGVLRAWDDGDELIFQIENRLDQDTAPAIQAPTSHRLSGRGLWLASHLVDDLAIEVTADNAIVRLHLASTRPTQVS